MTTSKRYIRASDLGTFSYCQRSWHLQRTSPRVTADRAADRARGTSDHRRHATEVQAATSLIEASSIAMWLAACLIIGAVLGWVLQRWFGW